MNEMGVKLVDCGLLIVGAILKTLNCAMLSCVIYRSEECRVDEVWAICGRYNGHIDQAFNPIHFRQQLRQDTLPHVAPLAASTA